MAASDAATISASQEESAIDFCFLDPHEIAAELNLKTNPDVDWTALCSYQLCVASMVHDPCCTGIRLNANYQLNAAADAVIIVYELAKRAGNPPRRVRPRRTCSAGSHELRATVWRRSVPTTRGGETEGPEHMAVTSASGGNALSISLAQVEADFDPHVGARGRRSLPRRQPAEWSDDVRHA